MRNLGRVTFMVFALMLLLLILAFVLENQQGVSLLFLGWSLPQVPLSVAVILALLVGMLIGPFLTFLFGHAKRQRQRPSI
jgi:uncharacterized integral membrane protein